jgi:tRNA(Ile)-lysidine synthase
MPKVSVLNLVEGALREAGVASGERLLVAVSGGVDSMVLLEALSRVRERLGLRLYVAHLHHGLRGRAADRDAAFVVAEAARWGLGVSVGRLDPAERGPGQSVQVWAREARYRCLEAIGDQVRAARILVAHTQDDQAETVLLNLLRGTGPRGLAGIPPARDRILRPLLRVSRADVEAYAAARHVPFRTDASNASEAYRRNRIRHQLLPLLAKEYNPRIVGSLAALAALAREDYAALEAQAAALLATAVQAEGPGVSLDVAALRSAPAAVARRAFQAAFRMASRNAHSLTRRHLEGLRSLLAREGLARLPGGMLGRRNETEIWIGAPRAAATAIADRDSDRTEIRIGPSRDGTAPGEVPLPLGVWTRWPPLDCRIRVRRLGAVGITRYRRDRWREILSLGLLEAPLSLRGWRPGDRFRPLGLPGRKKLQDFFVDAKVPRHQRGWLPLLLSGGRIAWVVGHRIAEEFRWRGGGAACLVEVEFPEKQHQLKTDNVSPELDAG